MDEVSVKWVVSRDAALHQLACNPIAGVKDQLLGMAEYIIHSWTKRPCSDLVAYYRDDGDIDVLTKSYAQSLPGVFLVAGEFERIVNENIKRNNERSRKRMRA